MGVPGVSTLGSQFGYGTETTAGEKPTSFTELSRINSIGSISVDPEQIDASAIIDKITKYVKGRADTGGTCTITINLTDDTLDEWGDLIQVYQALGNGLSMWFETIIPGLSKACYFVAQPPEQIPQPEIGQNQLLTVEINLTIEDYKGWDTPVKFSAG